MRAVIRTAPGKLEVAFMLLPTFIGMDTPFLKELGARLSKDLVGKPMTDAVLDDAHNKVLDAICERHKAIIGLRDYLESLKYVEQEL